jgi:hypothetical protein
MVGTGVDGRQLSGNTCSAAYFDEFGDHGLPEVSGPE